MKKIKKILPVLLGVMVLMFGTLTVCAASEDSPYYDNAMSVYESFKKYVVNSTDFALSDFKYIYIGTDKVAPQSEYRLIASTEPFTVDSNGYYKFGNGYVIAGGKNYGASSNMTFNKFGVCGSMTTAYFIPRFSNFPLYNSSNTLLISANDDFFKIPPVALVAQGLPEVVTAQTKVILTTAVACLALLAISLASLRRLPLFLNR